MVTIIQRMRKLKTLLAIRLGPGAAVLPNDVKRIHLEFAHKLNDGHFGARKFWRNHLPRLKYHNPAVSMTINRSADQTGPATLTVFFAPPPPPPRPSSSSNPPSASPAPSSSTSTATSPSEHTPFDRAETIDMKHKHESDILSQLLSITQATPVVATPDEVVELRQLEDQRKRSEQDALMMAGVNEKRRREQALLQQARGSVAENEAVA
ncbi:hypothetical protein MMC06_005817 [Schaereria dolodes]|nr:hypothetical protein [Schaereria dolodes]